jgi:hypothetical protein
MKTVVADAGLVGYCALYCGACGSYLKDRCPGCHENQRATWCKVRECFRQGGIPPARTAWPMPTPGIAQSSITSFQRSSAMFSDQTAARVSCRFAIVVSWDMQRTRPCTRDRRYDQGANDPWSFFQAPFSGLQEGCKANNVIHQAIFYVILSRLYGEIMTWSLGVCR